jgi:hypothetical protein
MNQSLMIDQSTMVDYPDIHGIRQILNLIHTESQVHVDAGNITQGDVN